MFMNLVAFADEAEQIVDSVEGTPVPSWTGMLVQPLMLVLLIALFYFIILRPQQKKEKKAKEMLAALKVGDKIQTIGGIVGKVTKIKDDEVVFETGSIGNPNEKSFMRVAKWAVKDLLKM